MTCTLQIFNKRPLQQSLELHKARVSFRSSIIESHTLTSQMQEVGKSFFNISMEEKQLYRNEQARSPISYGRKLGYTQDVKMDWGDYY